MPLPRVYRVIQDSLGNVVPQVLCSVLNQGTGVLATLWQNDAGTIPLANPMTSDATYGSFGFYVEPGHYDLTFTKPGYTFQPHLDVQVPQDDLTLGTMAQQNASAVAITGGSASFDATVAGRGGFSRPNGAGNDQYALYSELMAAGGTTRYGLRLAGDAPHYLVGHVGIAQATPSYPLDVVGQVRVMGQVAIGTTPHPNMGLAVSYDKTANNGLRLWQQVTDGGSGAAALFLSVAATTIGSITTTASATAFNTSSDVRLKRNIQPLTNTLASLRAVRPVAHRWTVDDSPGESFLAHELMVPFPLAVTGQPDEVNADGSIKPQQVDMSKMIPRMTAWIQELLAKVETLEAQMAALQGA